MATTTIHCACGRAVHPDRAALGLTYCPDPEGLAPIDRGTVITTADGRTIHETPLVCSAVGTRGGTAVDYYRADGWTPPLRSPESVQTRYRAAVDRSRSAVRAAAAARRADRLSAPAESVERPRSARITLAPGEIESLMDSGDRRRWARVPVALDGATWPVRVWAQRDERPAARAAERRARECGAVVDGPDGPIRVWAAVLSFLTGRPMGAPVRWRDPVTLGAYAEPTGPLVVDAVRWVRPPSTGQRVRPFLPAPVAFTVESFPLPLDGAIGPVPGESDGGYGGTVRACSTPSVVEGKPWPAGGRSDRVARWSAPGSWALVPGEYPAPVDPSAPGRSESPVNGGPSGKVNRSSGRVPRVNPDAAIGATARENALAAAESDAERAAIRAVPVPERTGDSGADRKAATRYRAAIGRAVKRTRKAATAAR